MLKAANKIVADGHTPPEIPSRNPPGDHVNIGASRGIKKPRYVMEVSAVRKKHAKLLKNRCILTSSILGFLQCLFSGPNPVTVMNNVDLSKIFLNPRNSHSKYMDRDLEKLIAKFVKEVINEDPLFDNKSLVEKLSFLSSKWDINFIVFNNKYKNEIIRYPDPPVDLTKRKVHLLINRHEDHIQFIHDVQGFFNQGFYCPYCNIKVSSYLKQKHDCKVKEVCKSCHRFILGEKEFTNHNFDNVYCKAVVDKSNLRYNCENCKLELSDAKCYASHRKVCRWRFKCNYCDAYIWVNATQQSRAEMLKKHKCSDKYHCWDCGLKDRSKYEHQCQLKKFRRQSCMDKVSFLMFNYSATKILCTVCKHNLDDEGIDQEACLLHSKIQNLLYHEHELHPSSAVFLTESHEREHFDVFFSTDLNILPQTIPLNLHIPYLNDNPICKEYEFTGPFGRKATVDSLTRVKATDFLALDDDGVVQQILKQIIEPHIKKDITRYHTILVDSEKGLSLLEQELQSRRFEIKCKASESNQIREINIPGLKLRFLNRSEFFSESLAELNYDMGIHSDLYFFPGQMNHRYYYNYVGPLPSVQAYDNFSTATLKQKKRQTFI